jgi:hypothetical protein
MDYQGLVYLREETASQRPLARPGKSAGRRRLRASFGFFDGGDEGENFVEAGDLEHVADAGNDACEGHADAVVATEDFVVDDLTHSGRIEESDASHIEDGEGRRCAIAKFGSQRENVAESELPGETEDYGSRGFARFALDGEKTFNGH